MGNHFALLTHVCCAWSPYFYFDTGQLPLLPSRVSLGFDVSADVSNVSTLIERRMSCVDVFLSQYIPSMQFPTLFEGWNLLIMQPKPTKFFNHLSPTLIFFVLQGELLAQTQPEPLKSPCELGVSSSNLVNNIRMLACL